MALFKGESHLEPPEAAWARGGAAAKGRTIYKRRPSNPTEQPLEAMSVDGGEEPARTVSSLCRRSVAAEHVVGDLPGPVDPPPDLDELANIDHRAVRRMDGVGADLVAEVARENGLDAPGGGAQACLGHLAARKRRSRRAPARSGHWGAAREHPACTSP